VRQSLRTGILAQKQEAFMAKGQRAQKEKRKPKKAATKKK
jgi:hypothetical protein